jgi:hypothetical protein
MQELQLGRQINVLTGGPYVSLPLSALLDRLVVLLSVNSWGRYFNDVGWDLESDIAVAARARGDFLHAGTV